MVENLKGYHGTSKSSAEKIMQQNKFKCSTGDMQWLGTGIYFFEHANLAVWWAKTKSKKNKNIYVYNAPIVVLEVNILVNRDRFLDLSDPFRKIEYFEKFYKPRLVKYLEDARNKKKKIAKTRDDKIKIFNIMIDIYKRENNIEVVRTIFEKDGYSTIGDIRNKENDDLHNLCIDFFNTKLHEIQICVVDNKNISNIKIYQ